MRRLDFLPPLNTCSCKRTEPFCVFSKTEEGFRLIETQPTLVKAEHAVMVLNEHERKQGRPEIYDSIYNPDE